MDLTPRRRSGEGDNPRQPPKTLEEVIQRVQDMERKIDTIDVSMTRIETALIGEWNQDGTYRDGWIQQTHRMLKTAAWLGAIATSVVTALCIFIAENASRVHH